MIFRQDDAIPDGICNPEQCPQYQSRQCNLGAQFIFAIPDIKGLGLIELPTNSIYVLQKAYAAMKTVQLARGKLTGTKFWISKREFDITRINEAGDAVRQMQMLTVLDADIDIGALLDGAEDATAPIEGAGRPTLPDSGSTVIHLHPSEGESPAMRADQAVAADGPPESMDEKRHRMQDLLQRLRFVEEDQRKAFRIYGHFRFGRGWVERPTDVDKMIARLTTALEDPTSLQSEIGAAVESYHGT